MILHRYFVRYSRHVFAQRSPTNVTHLNSETATNRYNEDRLMDSKPFWFFVFDRIFIARSMYMLFANARIVFFCVFQTWYQKKLKKQLFNIEKR